MVYIKDILKEKKRALFLKVVPENPPASMPRPFSHIRLFATPWTIARQAALSMEFSRQVEWVALPSSRRSF